MVQIMSQVLSQLMDQSKGGNRLELILQNLLL